MLKIIQKSSQILKNNLVFIQPLLLCLLVFMTISTFFINKNVFIAGKICICTSIILLTVAFTAGWLHINKLAIYSYNEDDSQEEIASKTINNIKKFFEGIGENFPKIFASYLIITILSFATIFFTSKLLLATIGEPKLVFELPKLAKASSQAEILNFVKNISTHDKLVFSLWMLISNIILFITTFFTVLYLTIITFEKDNFIESVWTTIKFFFKNFTNSISIMLFIFILYLALNFISLLLGTNTFSLVIFIILFAVYLNYYILLVFCFYNDKAENNSNNRTEFIG